MRTFHFGIYDPDSEYCGYEFLVEAPTRKEAFKIAENFFPDETIQCYGTVSQFEAEWLGIDTY